MIGKHAECNVEGPNFRFVHHELDQLVDAWRRLSDEVAERTVMIGAFPAGEVEAIAGATPFKPLLAGHLGDEDVLREIAERLGDASERTRERIDRVAGGDASTTDLRIRMAGTLEKQLWMIRARGTDPARSAV